MSKWLRKSSADRFTTPYGTSNRNTQFQASSSALPTLIPPAHCSRSSGRGEPRPFCCLTPLFNPVAWPSVAVRGGRKAHAKKQRRKGSRTRSSLCADRWVSRSMVHRSNAIVVFGLSKWLMKSSADRFTTPYADTPLLVTPKRNKTGRGNCGGRFGGSGLKPKA